ncbi:UbiA prenyltransferase family-domain-containing protein [Aspergillus carlsbadensis]|nr:UbiA prenyltransferase family-domain-containing protein [Aspergillus carlsbadensis]
MYSKSWILTSLPPSIAPYVELTRVGYLPAGVLISYLPVLVPLLHVATISHLPADTVLDASLKWLLLCFNYSAYGCVVDDLADVDLDRKVERCQHRPLVRGAVSVTQGVLFAATLAASALTLTTTFFPNQPATHVPIAIAGSIIYPFLKRWTNYALLFLALLYVSTGLNASRTLGFDILSLPPHNSLLHSNLLLNAAIYIANITVETIYMHADVEDDIKSGINSLAVRMYGYSKPVLSLMALSYGALVLGSGVLAGFSAWYFTAASVSAVTLLTIVARVDLKDGKQCEVYFFGGNALVMASLAGGLWAEYQYGGFARAAAAVL